jgi:hypothetical protein
MAERLVVGVVVISNGMRVLLVLISLLISADIFCQDTTSQTLYKKRVLENTEVDILMSYYTQDGNNSAVTGGIGTEELTDLTPTIVVSIPLNDDDVLTIDAGISAYSSASSSNIDPFDGDRPADPYYASSGASRSDVWAGFVGTYSHSSDDRNSIWAANASFSAEYDYLSLGFGGSYTRLFNHKNTEWSIKGNVYLDKWSAIYPIELSTYEADQNHDDEDGFNIDDYLITGNPDYNPEKFVPFESETRNSYSLGMTFSQILSKRMQALVSVDAVLQEGLLSTPYHRIYFKDQPDSFIEDFHLADDIERLPDQRFKIALGGRLNYFLSQRVTVRTYYRYYSDDWDIDAHTVSITVPVKLNDRFTLYPSYRYYTQTATSYFASYNQHLSTETYYTSDYDLSKFESDQFGFGVSYTDIFTKLRIWKFGLKSVDLQFIQYNRDTGLKSSIISAGFKFVLD